MGRKKVNMPEREVSLQEQAKAAQEGRGAYMDGKAFLSCPYDRSMQTKLWDAWRAGYLMMLKSQNI